MQIRAASLADLPVLLRLQDRIDDDTDTALRQELLAFLVQRFQVLVAVEADRIVAYCSIAAMTDEAEQKYLRDGILDLQEEGPNLWVLEYAGDDGALTKANRLFMAAMKNLGYPTYRFFRERDKHPHEVRI